MFHSFNYGPVTVHDTHGKPWLLLEACPLEDVQAITELAKADQGERWITLKPHGHDGEGGGYVHVKIKVSHDGSAHVVSGPGELRGLRLTRLASKEELEQRRKDREQAAKVKRQDAKKQAEAKDREDLEQSAKDPAHAQRLAQEKLDRERADEERHAKLKDLHERMTGLHEQLLEKARTLTGDDAYGSERARATFDPAAYDDYKKDIGDASLERVSSDPALRDGDQAEDLDAMLDNAKVAGAVIASRNVRAISTGLKNLRRKLINDLVQDSELKDAVLGADGEVDTAPLQTPGRVSDSPGYARNTAQAAGEQGFTPEDARAESDEAFDRRVTALRQDGQDDRADAIVKMRDQARARGKVDRYLKGKGDETIHEKKPVASVPTQELVKKGQDVREFLHLHTQLEALEREKRQLLARQGDVTPTEQQALDEEDLPKGAEVDADIEQVSAALNKKLEGEVRDAAQADLTRAFLDAVDDPDHAGHAGDLIRRSMTAHIGSGTYGHLSNVAFSVLGHEGLDRRVVDTLGTDASAQLLAHAIRRDQSAKLDDTRAGLASYHDQQSLTQMRDALEFAQATRSAAAQIQVPSITDGTESAVVRDLIKQKKTHIAQAQERLGQALGEVEAGAALNLALKGGQRASVQVRFGLDSTANAAMNLRALGLQDGEYTLTRDPKTNALTATIHQDGMNRLTQPLDDERAKLSERAARLKSGLEDEEHYLPAGFLARNPEDEVQNPGIPPAFQAPADFSQGVQATVQEQAARMYADGKTPRQILTHLLDSVSRDVPAGHEAEFAQRVTDLIPFAATEERTARDGTRYTAHVARDVDNDPDIQNSLQALAENFLHSHQPGAASFHGQRLDDNTQTRDALFRAVAEDPALQAAFSPPGDLGGTQAGRQRAAAIKGYFLRKVVPARLDGLTPGAFDERQQQRQDQALSKLGGMPDKWGGGGDLFGGFGADAPASLRLNPLASPEQHAAALSGYGLRAGEHYTLQEDQAVLTDAGKAAVRVPDGLGTVDGTPEGHPVILGGLDGLNPAWVQWQAARAKITKDHPTTADLWNAFKTQCGGTTRAYQAVQEQMQGDLVRRFTEHQSRLSGQQLRVSKRTGQHWEARVAASDPAKAAEIRARDRALLDELRERDTGGRYAQMEGGSLASAVQARVARLNAQSLLQGGLGFDLFGSKGGGEVQGQSVHDLDVQPHEVPTIGRGAEAQLARILNSTSMGLKVTDAPTFVIPGLDWGAGTKHVGKQRGVKMLLDTGRLLGFYGAGSGKTGMQIGAFTQAHAEGRARKALMVVPSIVRNQFGEEAARFTEPGKYSWHAQDSSYAERKAHYQGETHMVVTTHQTFRDDMMRLMAEHNGVNVGEMQAKFDGLDRAGRAATLGAALEHHGIPLDYLSVDEAHDFLNRAGKQDSGMSRVLEAALDNAKFKSLWTGSPVKNDASEIYDWIEKVDPGRFQNREEFMRRYGVNTRASRESLQRLMDGYSYVDSVTPDVKRTVTWGQRDAQGVEKPITLSEKQKGAYEAVNRAFEACSRAARRGEVDVDSAKVLSPRSFELAHPQDHAFIAGRVQSALGTLKHNALSRIVNEFDAQHNAKVQHVLSLAGERRGRGGVIFARNRASVAMLKQELERDGHRVGVIDGRSSSDDKARVRKAFDAGQHDIVICSDAGATGANLQARGEWLVNYDLPMTYKTMEQRNARIDRLGQKRAIELHHLTTDTPYDRDNVKRLTEKRELGSALQGEFRSLEDTGVAAHLIRAAHERQGDALPSWEEPLGPVIHENQASQKPAVLDVDQGALPSAIPPTDAPGRAVQA